ncbi:zinc-dependent metalloprotease [Tessaracoccus sp. MC1756]|uniref:zinc-dependent metalloprotease n=1 Tax=Tessaracoccus sp. MC1756 TaxID=2760311 RepID=UPI0016009623|nr:zinc-dependent metalloprotease [Tessaracoccus sp. MC1756]
MRLLMEHAPSINWRLAHRVAALRPDDLPDLTSRELTRLVADLRVTARRAGEIAAKHLGLQAVGATRVRVVDWDGWGRAVRGMADGAVTELGLGPADTGTAALGSAVRNGLLIGVGMRAVSRRLLGQYDAFTGSDTLYLVAPTIVAHERSHRFTPAHFRMWVALHEQTHALQFRLAPWLRDYVAERMRLVVHDEVPLGEGLLRWARTRDVSALLTSADAATAMAELTATMTFLEGHADYTSDYAGRRHAPTIPGMRRAFARPERAGLLARLSKSLDKNAQYRDGLEFCLRVQRLKNRAALKRAFERPDNLPTAEEISDPALWLQRVHG